jgi:hypothetical protein
LKSTRYSSSSLEQRIRTPSSVGGHLPTTLATATAGSQCLRSTVLSLVQCYLTGSSLPWAWHACGIIWERQLNRVRRKMCDAFQPVVVHNIMVPCALPKKKCNARGVSLDGRARASGRRPFQNRKKQHTASAYCITPQGAQAQEGELRQLLYSMYSSSAASKVETTQRSRA